MCLTPGNQGRKEKPGQLRCTERVRVAPLRNLLHSPNIPPNHWNWVMAVFNKGKRDETGEYIDLNVTYTHSAGTNFGRLYASKPSLQTCPGYIRRLCSSGIYVDIDIKNAFPTILVQLAERHGLSAPLLRAYVNDREGWINTVCADIAVSFKQVKNAMLITMHGGGYKQAVENKSHEKLTSFAAEVKQLAASLSEVAEYTELWEKAQAAQKDKKAKKGRDVYENPRGTFISWICQIQEADLVSAAKDYFEEEPQNLKVGCVVFDGLMPYWEGGDRVSDALLRGASDHAFKKTGISVEFAQKSLEPTPEDLAAAGTSTSTLPSDWMSRIDADPEQQLAQLDPKQKLILFDFNGTLGGSKGSKKLRPGIEALKQLPEAGFAIGIWSNASRERIPLHEMALKHGLYFSVVLTGDHCTESTAAYRKEHNLGLYDNKLKCITERFPDHPRVIIVDDTPGKIPPGDRHMLRPIKTWNPNDPQDHKELPKMVKKLLAEDKGGCVPGDDHDGADEPSGPQTISSDDEEIVLEDTPDRGDGSGEKTLRPIEFPPGVRLVAIIAAMGLGKTHTSLVFLRDFFRKKPDARVLFISNRRQQSHTFMSFLNTIRFQHYSDIEGGLGDINRLVVQYESLGRLVGGELAKFRYASYDLVVLDEARAVTGQVNSPHNGQHFQFNASVYRSLLESATKVLMMDADLVADAMMRDLITDIWPRQEQRKILRYTHVPLQRQIALVKDQDTLYANIHRDIMEGRKIMIIFREKEEMLKWLVAERNKGEFTYLKIDGDTPETVVKETFADINAAVRGVQVFCFTSKVTTGADIQVKFYRVYAHCKTRFGPPAREVYQMIGRARCVEHTEILVLLPTPLYVVDSNSGLEGRAKSENRRLKNQQITRASASTAPDLLPVLQGREVVFTGDWLLNLTSQSIAEQSECFCIAFRRHTLRKGYTFVGPEMFARTEEETSAATDAMKEGKLLHAKEKKAEVKALLAEVQNLGPDAMRTAERDITAADRDTQTPAEKTKLQMIFALKRFPVDVRPNLSLKQIQWFDKNHKRLKRAAWIREVMATPEYAAHTVAALRSQDMAALFKAGFPEEQPLDKHAMTLVDGLLREVGFVTAELAGVPGFGGIFDRTTELEGSRLEEVAKTKNVFKKFKEFANYACVRSCRGESAIGVLQLMLNHFGYTLKMKQKGKKKVVWYSLQPLKMTETLLDLGAHFNFSHVEIEPNLYNIAATNIEAVPSRPTSSTTNYITPQGVNLPQAPAITTRRAAKRKEPEPPTDEDASITRERNKIRKAAGFDPLSVQGKIRFNK